MLDWVLSRLRVWNLRLTRTTLYVELIACNKEKMLFGKSLKLGAIRLADKYLKKDPPPKSTLKGMDLAVMKDLQATFKNSRVQSFQQVVATSGMAANLAEVIYFENKDQP